MKKFSNLIEVRLFFPNNWRRHVGDLASSKDKRFNWFLCSQRYMDPESGLYIAEIAKGAVFYDEHNGHTLVVPKDQPTRVLILEDLKHVQPKTVMDTLTRYHYQGVAYPKECDLKDPDHFVICREVIFGFVDGALEISRQEKSRLIIEYAKKNNACLREAIPGFPSSSEIEESLETHERSIVCKALYQDVMTYMKK